MRRTRIDPALHVQVVARGFDVAAVAGRSPAARRQEAINPGCIIRPGDHRPAVAVLDGVGLDRGAGFHCRFLRVGDAVVLALPAPAEQDFAAPVGTAHVDDGAAAQHDLVRRDLNLPAPVPLAGDDRAADVGAVLTLEHHLAALGRDAGGLDQAAVFELAGEDSDGIALQRPQIDSAVPRRLQFQADTFQPAAGQLDLLAGEQQRRAVGRLHQRFLADFDLPPDQDHIAIAPDDGAVDSQRARCRCRAVVPEQQAPGQRVRLAHAQGGGGEAGGVDHRTGPHRNAGRVDQHQPPIGAEGAVDGRRVVAQDPVDRQALRVGLVESGGRTAGNREALPVDGRVTGARAVLSGDEQRIALLQQGGLAMNHLGAGGLAGGGVRQRDKGGGNCQRHASGPEPGRDGIADGLSPRAGWRGAERTALGRCDGDGGRLVHGCSSWR